MISNIIKSLMLRKRDKKETHDVKKEKAKFNGSSSVGICLRFWKRTDGVAEC